MFPDVDRDDSSLEGTCATAVEEAFDAAIANKPCLLTESGELKAGGEAVLIPAALLEVWPDDQAAAVLDDAARPPLSRHVSAANQQKLIHWNLIEAFTKSKVVELLRAKHLPKPKSLRHSRSSGRMWHLSLLTTSLRNKARTGPDSASSGKGRPLQCQRSCAPW